MGSSHPLHHSPRLGAMAKVDKRWQTSNPKAASVAQDDQDSAVESLGGEHVH
jgi:hypothetical protein